MAPFGCSASVPDRRTGLSPREGRVIDSAALVGPGESPYRNGGPRSVLSRGHDSLDVPAGFPPRADGTIVRVRASDPARRCSSAGKLLRHGGPEARDLPPPVIALANASRGGHGRGHQPGRSQMILAPSRSLPRQRQSTTRTILIAAVARCWRCVIALRPTCDRRSPMTPDPQPGAPAAESRGGASSKGPSAEPAASRARNSHSTEAPKQGSPSPRPSVYFRSIRSADGRRRPRRSEGRLSNWKPVTSASRRGCLHGARSRAGKSAAKSASRK